MNNLCEKFVEILSLDDSAKQILDLKIYLYLIEICSTLLYSIISVTAVVINY